ncbi:hypothetical protein [Streptacidiphilus sp. EB129]|uniref:DinB/UmuC family translesion DNA polymerase n=1 Tax=Streptacidiphilus sp. EB129 TaxID=3156262 RepID=UPI0035151794
MTHSAMTHSTMTRTARTVAYMHLHRVSDETYRQLFGVLADVTPVVQALPSDAALLDLTGALRYFDSTPADLGMLAQIKVLARYGVESTVGIGPNRMLATLAAQTADPTAVRVLPDDPATIAAFLGPLPVQALPDVGPRTGRALATYGLTTVADLRTVPLATLQRITSAGTGRLLAERAHGHDPRTVQPGGPPSTLSVRRDFDRDTLDPDTTRRALLSCALELGARLRGSGQVTGRLELEIRFADRSSTSRSRTLREATDHTATLQLQLYDLFESLGLQRARLRTMSVRARGLRPVESASVQLTFDRRTELRRRLDPIMDKATTCFGPGALTRAALLLGGARPRPAGHAGALSVTGMLSSTTGELTLRQELVRTNVADRATELWSMGVVVNGGLLVRSSSAARQIRISSPGRERAPQQGHDSDACHPEAPGLRRDRRRAGLDRGCSADRAGVRGPAGRGTQDGRGAQDGRPVGHRRVAAGRRDPCHRRQLRAAALELDVLERQHAGGLRQRAAQLPVRRVRRPVAGRRRADPRPVRGRPAERLLHVRRTQWEDLRPAADLGSAAVPQPL